MRPVLLDMDGFASFRDQATVDFADSDYFALVGPTGSGKSTVIDAMTFALYGSVPRWQDRRMVMYALAPTANRGTVRLVFDVEGTAVRRRAGGSPHHPGSPAEERDPGKAGRPGRHRANRRGKRGHRRRPQGSQRHHRRVAGTLVRRFLPVCGAAARSIRGLPQGHPQGAAGHPAQAARCQSLRDDRQGGEPTREHRWREGTVAADPAR